VPYPNEHSGRVRSPDSFRPDSFRRKNVAPGVDIIMGKLKGEDAMTVQAYRFDRSKFTPAEARKWLKEHDITIISFEPASNEEMNQNIRKKAGR